MIRSTRHVPLALAVALVGFPAATSLAGGDRPRVEAEPSPRPAGPGSLGLEITDLTDELAEHLGAENGGVLVGRVVSDGAADRAGVRVGDVVTGLDGRRIDSGRDLRRELSFYDAGETVALDVVRDGRALELSTTLDAARSARTRSHYGRHDLDIHVDVGDLVERLADLGVVIGHEVGHALARVDWDEIGEAIEEGLEGLEDLEEIEIDMREMERELEEGLRELERELEREMRHVDRQVQRRVERRVERHVERRGEHGRDDV